MPVCVPWCFFSASLPPIPKASGTISKDNQRFQESQGSIFSLVVNQGLLIAVVSLVVELGLYSTGKASVAAAHGPSCSAARGIFLNQGSETCLLHWQADSLPLTHLWASPFLHLVFPELLPRHHHKFLIFFLPSDLPLGNTPPLSSL